MNEEVRGLVSRMSEASLLINQNLDRDEVLQAVLDAIRMLTGARSGAMALFDPESGEQELLFTGLTSEQTKQSVSIPRSREVFEALTDPSEAMRIPDIKEHLHRQGFTLWSPVKQADKVASMSAPLAHQDRYMGHVFVANKSGGGQFTETDEEILVMFTAQAALVIGNANSRRSEQEAKASLEFMAETSPAGVAILDAQTGVMKWSNREASLILDGMWSKGQSFQEQLDQAICVQPDGQEIFLKDLPWVETLGAGKPVRGEEIALRTPDGQIINVLLNANPIRSEHGRIDSVMVVFQDLAPLEQQERLRAEFLAMVSHELRAPLAAVKGSVTTLLESANVLGPVEMAQFFGIIRDQSDQMHFLISDLLDVAHIETGTLPVAPEPADVYLLVDEARTRFLSQSAHNAVETELGEGLPLVMADRRRILQVLGNLLSNASQASPHGLPIRVAAALDEGHVAITVADQGKGVSPEVLPDLFRKYTRRSDTHGSGLGLAICKGIVEAHGGRIRAQSSGPNLGAQFTFTLPAVAAPTAGSAPDSPQSRPAGPKAVRVLAVDDDPQALRYVRDILTKEGYAPISTSDPADVPRLVAWEKPHLALLDLVMPGTDGIELMNAVRKTADIPVIIMSAYGQDNAAATALNMGAADYLVKPFSATELDARIRAALRKAVDPFSDEPTEPYEAAGLHIDYARRRATLDGKPVELTATEYAVLYELAAHAPRVLTHSVLLQRVWGPERVGESQPLRDIVKRLRSKLGDDANNPKYIFTEPRVGYWMAEQ
ncbi:response regulator [Candidatus Poriferisocius sp.]|uniref:hybrid sensor histidine kinase/response regulator n=1 Tax=Candidatus Poriferisocius sp. TaxID=3101276 RepID=UPI003B023584